MTNTGTTQTEQNIQDEMAARAEGKIFTLTNGLTIQEAFVARDGEWLFTESYDTVTQEWDRF